MLFYTNNQQRLGTEEEANRELVTPSDCDMKTSNTSRIKTNQREKRQRDREKEIERERHDAPMHDLMLKSLKHTHSLL